MKRILAALLSFALCLALLLFIRSEPDEPLLHVALKPAGEQDAAYVYETVYASGKSRRCDAFTPDTCVFYTADYADFDTSALRSHRVNTLVATPLYDSVGNIVEPNETMIAMMHAAASRGLHRQEQTQTVLIENTGACSAYVYAPYALSALPQESALRTDSLESTQLPASGLRGARQYRFTMPLAPEQTAAELLDALREQPEKADAYLSAEGSYRAFVQEQDVKLPEQARAQLAPILDELCREFDLGRPIWLERNIREFQRHSKTRFHQDSFIEEIDFDYLEIQILEE